MTEDEKLVAELRRDEGVRAKLYQDSAKPPRWTIGVGRNLSDRPLSDDEIDYLLMNDIDMVVAQLAGTGRGGGT